MPETESTPKPPAPPAKKFQERLTRDRAPEFPKYEGATFRKAVGEELTLLLAQKLVQEAEQLVTAAKAKNNTNEVYQRLADVEEVHAAIKAHVGLTDEGEANLRLRKARERGGYSQGLVIVSLPEKKKE